MRQFRAGERTHNDFGLMFINILRDFKKINCKGKQKRDEVTASRRWRVQHKKPKQGGTWVGRKEGGKRREKVGVIPDQGLISQVPEQVWEAEI